jgi:rubrerythrin
MPQANQMGLNRTGMDMAPDQGEAMMQGVEQADAGLVSYDDLEKIRRTYLTPGGSVGSVPIPGSLRGTASTLLEKFKGHHPEILINKLGERLAFERAGVRLYEALILKCEATPDDASARIVSLELLEQFRDEEAEHYFMVKKAIETLGADPTAQTPDADVAGVASLGINKVMTDPRTSIRQCLEALQIAELTDNAAWGLLQDLCLSMGLQDIADEFEHAIAQEETHAATIAAWLRDMTLLKAGSDGENRQR